jgi:YVTN family beta-propeller protein
VTATIAVGTTDRHRHGGRQGLRCNYGDATVSVIDIATNAIVALVHVGLHPTESRDRDDRQVYVEPG